jgi:integrase
VNRAGGRAGIGGRPVTGSIVWEDPKTKTKPIGVRVMKADGKRKLLRFDPGTTADDAIVLAPVLAERAKHAIEGRAETVSEYAKRWCEWRESRGLGCVAGDRSKLASHVFPSIGSLDVRAVTRDDLKRLVALLDAKVKRGHTVDARGQRRPFGWKTAETVWSTVRALFRDARGAKRVDLCLRHDDPSEGLTGPDVGTRKVKTYLWPSEFARLVHCDAVPVRWRRLFTLAVYTLMRAGELAALEWADVDLDHAIIHVHRSNDRVRRRGVKPTKSNVARRIPIDPALMPLLKALHDQSKGRGHVFPMPSVGILSRKLKVYLARADVIRADLFTSDATRKAITFHDLRATGITWCAVRGDDPLKIMQRAGHADFQTTQIYLREAENLASSFGTVFPAIPPALLEAAPAARPRVLASVLAFGHGHLTMAAKKKGYGVEPTRIESAYETSRSHGNRARFLVGRSTRPAKPREPRRDREGTRRIPTVAKRNSWQPSPPSLARWARPRTTRSPASSRSVGQCARNSRHSGRRYDDRIWSHKLMKSLHIHYHRHDISINLIANYPIWPRSNIVIVHSM